MKGEKRSRVEKDPLFWNYCKYTHKLQLLSFQLRTVLSASVLQKHLKAQKHGTQRHPFSLHEYKTWSITLKEQH